MGYQFSSRLTATLNLCLIYFKITCEPSILLEHMHKQFEINITKIKGGCRSGRKVVNHNSKSDLPLVHNNINPTVQNCVTIHNMKHNMKLARFFFFASRLEIMIVLTSFQSVYQCHFRMHICACNAWRNGQIRICMVMSLLVDIL